MSRGLKGSLNIAVVIAYTAIDDFSRWSNSVF